MKARVFKIEKNVKIPETAGLRGRIPTYPFGSMKVGDSFCAPKEAQKSLRCAAIMYGKRNNMRFTTRSQDNGQIRIWRIA